jgi:hypothetical protein
MNFSNNIVKFLLLSGVSVMLQSTPGNADTCTAPGHSSCTITCTGGCGVVYSEPSGPCHAFCDRSTKSDAMSALTVDFKMMPSDQIGEELAKLKKK